MKDKLLKLYKKNEEIVNYFIIGVCTTLVSLGVKYGLLFTILDPKKSFELQLAVIISWIVAVTFAYITNRKIVFKSKNKNILSEATMFFGARVTTLLMESFILWFFITLLELNTKIYVIIWTLVSQVLIFIGNYIISKFFVFNNNEKKIFNKKNIFFIILFIILFIISYMFPYAHDDWAWGSSIGIERLNSLFDGYNGRWLGNLSVLLLTRNRILKAFITSIVLTYIMVYIKKLINYENKNSIYLSILLMILMPVSIIAQSIAWVSGFTNYVIVILFLLMYINFNKNIFTNKKVEIDNKFIVLFLLLGFANSLFIEHITIYNLLLSIFVVLFIKYKDKKISIPNVSYLIGSLCGTILMFSNSAYHKVMNATDDYRTIEQGNIIIRSIKTYVSKLYDYLIYENHFLNIIVGILCLILIYKLFKNDKYKKIYRCILNIIIGIISFVICYELFVVLMSNNTPFITKPYIKLLESLLYGLYYVSIFVLMLFVSDKNRRFRFIFELASIILIAAPLLIVKPIGPRCFIDTYIFFVIFAIDLFDYIFKNDKFDLSNLFKYMIVIILFFYLLIYGNIYRVELIRNNYINNNKDATKLVLPKLPFENYSQHANPDGETFEERFKLFYNINKDTEVVFIPFKKWKKVYQ